ncbi:hypothetical protein MOQ18_12770 [Stenotrophomonas maltophilia]|uniref:hypothetical protein n=1 Tax=Stenotrophomonas maltophilia TaxID=40324 RepID=UPI001F535D4C|nr:hypothetical protein [Stenotrophomonas maltophilia]MCI1157034.1 hypothetical protein [Stenotrophomonas maltophilia]
MNDVDNACSCPSGDGSLCHPCSAHPAPADVQPGGRVRLGDQAERARFEAWVKNHVSSLARAADGEYASNFTHALWSAWQAALSAQPSPGGQQSAWILPDDARIVGVIADNIERGKLDHPGFYRNTQLGEVLRRVLSAALAARQPVNGLSWADYWMKRGQPDAAHDFDAFSRAEAWALQRFPYARQPVRQPVPFAVESKAFEAHAASRKLNLCQHPLHYLFLDRATDEARHAWKAALAFAPPAQAVDMTAAQAVAVYDAVTRRNFTRDVKTDEDKARTVIAALTDNQAVGQ